MMHATVVGAGLAGSEAAWFLANHGVEVTLLESRPHYRSAAHTTNYAAELVCSNSLKSFETARPTGLLKRELLTLGSLLIPTALKHRVPAGAALAVDRDAFSRTIQRRLLAHPKITLCRQEVTRIPERNAIIATGPLTSPTLFTALSDLLGEEGYFYDAIAPVVERDSIDFSHAFYGNRWDKGEEKEAYINCPLTAEEYAALVEALLSAETVTPRAFEDPIYFESCLPVEVMAARGVETLRHGPMRPVGLRDPKTGERPYAVLQLRMENSLGSAYNLVGFQTKMTYREQSRVLRLIPALRQATILRHGEIHRNSYFNAPRLLEGGLGVPERQNLLLSGLLLGVEGYVESMALGLFSGLTLASMLKGVTLPPPPKTSCLGGLLHHISTPNPSFGPTNMNFGLWPPLDRRLPKKERHPALIKRATEDFVQWYTEIKPFLENINAPSPPGLGLTPTQAAP